MKSILAIDPGSSSGAYAYRTEDGSIGGGNLPESPIEIVDLFRDLEEKVKPNIVYIEKTGKYMKGNSGPGAVKFARHCGALDVIPYALGLPSVYISPAKWMNHFPGKPKGSDTKDARKTFLYSIAATRFANVKINKKQGDAYCLLIYAMSLED